MHDRYLISEISDAQMPHEQKREVGVLGGGVSLGTDTSTIVVVDQLHRLGNLKFVTFGIRGVLPFPFIVLARINRCIEAVFIL